MLIGARRAGAGTTCIDPQPVASITRNVNCNMRIMRTGRGILISLKNAERVEP